MVRMIAGTRGSALAVRQTEMVLELLRTVAPGIDISLHTLTTRGDTVADRPISSIGDKGVFVRPFQQALLEGRIDIAVHSLKDVPSDRETPGLTLAAFPPREDARDVLVACSGRTLEELPAGARVGAGSLRRRFQILTRRPDIEVSGIRGNVDTRLRKLDVGEDDAIVLAAAGLLRMGLADRISEYLDPEHFVPDAGQGILAVETRTGDAATDLVARIDHSASRLAAEAERTVVRVLGADCHSPVGAFLTGDGNHIHIVGMAAKEDGTALTVLDEHAAADEAFDAARRLGERLKAAIAT